MSVDLRGVLDLGGTLVLTPRVLVGGFEALVVLPGRGSAPHAIAPPVPHQPPVDTGVTVWVVDSPNQTVRAGRHAIVAGGTVMQGDLPKWPGTVRPSRNNPEVRIGGTAISVVGDEGQIDPPGGPVVFTASGQE
jgi:hypothetical protein